MTATDCGGLCGPGARSHSLTGTSGGSEGQGRCVCVCMGCGGWGRVVMEFNDLLVTTVSSPKQHTSTLVGVSYRKTRLMDENEPFSILF